MYIYLIFNSKLMNYFTSLIVYIFFYSTTFAQLPELTPGWKTQKRGGIAFRVGANQDADKYLEYHNLFALKSVGLDSIYNFSMAMNLGMSEFDSQDYIDRVKFLIENGHELYDLTPNNRINYFITKFPTYNYSAEPGVDHRTGSDNNKICLKYMDVDPNEKSADGTATINNNIVIVSMNNGFNTFDKYDYLYFPSLDSLVMIGDITDINTFSVISVWGDDNINFENQTAVQVLYFDFQDIHMTPEGLVLLGKETQKLADLYGLERPLRMIVPGQGSTPWKTTSAEIKATYGDVLGYISAQTYVNPSLLTYNEFNPSGIKQYSMTWGQFDEEDPDIQAIKTKIADGIAKHKVLLSHGHFASENYFTNTDQILDWCRTNNIPVLTTTEWTTILYNNNTQQGKYINIFPPLNIDLDENGLPDGYHPIYSLGTYRTDDGPPGFGDSCYSSTDVERICFIDGLGGVEKGENDFEIWTKGDAGGSITVKFAATGMSSQNFQFSANTSDWMKYQTQVTFPTTISELDISISNVSSSGEVRIGGMSLTAHDPLPVVLTSFGATDSESGVKLNWETATEVNNYGFEIERAISNNNSPQATFSQWEKIAFVEGHGNSYSPKSYSFTDTTFLSGDIEYRLKQIDTDGVFEYSDIVSLNLIPSQESLSDDIENFLFQNHPNPFNPSTIISFQINKPSQVSIKIYDIIGNEVATLIDNEKKTAGNHSIEFNKYLANNELSSGVYFYQLIAGQYIETKKMLLLK